MSKLNIDQKIIKDLFGGKKSDFLIPDYQRPYAWGEKECQTLWHGNFLSKKTMNKSKDQQDDPGKRNRGNSEIAC